MVQQTIQFENVSLSEIGSGTLTAFLFAGDTLAATLANITENGTLKGRYTGTVDDEAAGDYRLVVKFDGYTVSEPDETVTLLLAVGTYVSARLAVLDPAVGVQLQAIEDGVDAGNNYHVSTLARIGSFAGTGVNNILGMFRALFRSDASTPSDMGGTATAADHSLQAVRVRGDAAWTTGTSGASLEDIISGVQSVSGAIVEAQNSATLSIRIGDTWTQDIGSLGDLTGKTVSFAMKKRASDADTAAIVFITEGTGLTRLNGTATTAGWGSITINDEVAGDITLRLESDATSILTSGSYVDAVKLLKDGDDRSPRNAGRTVVSAGVIADIT